PGGFVVGVTGGPGAVGDAVDAGDGFDPGVVGGLDDDHTAAEAPAHQREPGGVNVVHAGEPVYASADVFGPFLGNQPAPLALRAPDPPVVEGQHGVAQRVERPGEPFRVDDLLSLVAGAGDDRRVRGSGAAIIGQVQVGVEAQAAGEKGQRLAGHKVP